MTRHPLELLAFSSIFSKNKYPDQLARTQQSTSVRPTTHPRLYRTNRAKQTVDFSHVSSSGDWHRIELKQSKQLRSDDTSFHHPSQNDTKTDQNQLENAQTEQPGLTYKTNLRMRDCKSTSGSWFLDFCVSCSTMRFSQDDDWASIAMSHWLVASRWYGRQSNMDSVRSKQSRPNARYLYETISSVVWFTVVIFV